MLALAVAGGWLYLFHTDAIRETIAPASCKVSDIRILQANHIPSDGAFSHVVGEVANDCNEATAVVLRVTLRDQAGKVSNSQTFWPASMANIPPHTTLPFNHPIGELRQFPPLSMQIVVSEVHRWGARP